MRPGVENMSLQSLQKVRFGDFLVERNVINEGQLLDALAEHWISGCRIGESIARKGYIPKNEIERLVREFENLSTVYV
jgi:hypothetical protein